MYNTAATKYIYNTGIRFQNYSQIQNCHFRPKTCENRETGFEYNFQFCMATL